MSGHSKNSKAERMGRWLGRACRRGLRQDRRLWNWLRTRKVPVPVVFVVSWLVRLVMIAVLAYLSFWVLLVVVALAIFIRLPVSEVQLFRDHEEDHRLSGFYDPINYNDDPDPRFDGE
ncbi:hypothetical protein C4J95_2019 [Pseudomonas orientalis]|uniref:DUF3742 family protein n=1 Tax=Pseudomonas orientalis TaxID=76758 RepID=UPI000F564AFC|nr:DUF3742 family protein [Pseudomonas orientalis]AZE99481.1 hypothetical protein C4J95_2019 [Pseudomonas orientalis]